MTSKKKIAASVGAVGLAAVIALGGTFAWQSISQTALNETMDTINPGGRLHDDFNGKNKDVYVENFTEGEGATTIYARVRLDEYMEIGVAGGAATPLVAETSRDDVTTWTTRLPGTENMTEDTTFGAYWDWSMGGQTTYMPTFNMNKDSLKADINGTYDGTSDADDVHYDDYVDYSLPENATKTDDEIYDADTNDVDEADPIESTNITTVADQEHTVKQTGTAAVITMQQWIEEYDMAPGAYWVWDTDGWAYWAQGIEPGEATGLLLDEIVQSNPPSDSWYYGINVVGQFVTADDIGFLNGTGFYDESAGAAPTANAELLLETITGTNIPSSQVTVTAVGDATSVAAGNTLQFNAAVADKEDETIAEATVTWSVAGATDSEGTSIDENGLLTVSASEEVDTELTVTATYMDGDEAVTGSVTVTVTEGA